MKDEYQPNEFVEHIERLERLTIGDSIRVIHKFKQDGSICSLNKDACMMISKYTYFYYYYCYRCGEQGKVHLNKSPKQIIQEQKQKQKEEEKEMYHNQEFTLPTDCVLIDNQNDVPKPATLFLDKFRISNKEITDNAICYSAMYDRIIFPIYEHWLTTRSVGTQLVGWTGRCYHPMDKETRIQYKRPKYLTKKSMNTDRVFFTKFNKESRDIVIVEDCISALRIFRATAKNTMALLTTSFPNNIYNLLRTYENVIVWLDQDATKTAFKHTHRLNTLGIKTYLISTYNDPKMFGDSDLKRLINKRLKANG